MAEGMEFPKDGKRNARTAFAVLGIVAGMVGLSFASVPLYNLFCKVTGYGGTTQVASSVDGIPVLDQEVTVRFDANTAPGMGWSFRPVQRQVTLRLGEQRQIAYLAENTSNVPITGTATFNVTPGSAGIYFNKLACFCFTETTLQPGEKLEMPVIFFVDPDMASEKETKNIHTITLSYTFFPVHEQEKPLAGLTPEEDGGKQDSNIVN